ncbi:pantoate--beta-alanine ligase [Leptospira inadai serovar Lyme str. 10]|uniref:Pantothenate synthetase n=2 Tax=Leptospira inadai serovar Lyme TaxID=293084 RepID=V6HD69_9LEPT|nr:pantoate--beta-alanine ligase [Leptospira inadai]EQA38001.1 pantoate--beta-alanine ligase [Leptospira inadai serovar Lyme str. 10]PNV72813.1 pantoate--beta-alanine ligase [Leptospira inadai serovar Lyme]
MIVLKNPNEVRKTVRDWKSKGLSVGFAPTMGFLHEGHAALFERSVSGNDKTIVSIFVNPAQFNDPEDFAKYPVSTDNDLELCEKSGVDLVYLPDSDTVYPGGVPDIELRVPGLMKNLDAATRPGHFEGVLLVLSRFFHTVEADRSYFGKKDYQQYLIVKEFTKMLGFSMEIIGVDTIRNVKGLALSSRNARLSDSDKDEALLISRALKLAENLILNGEKDPAEIKTVMQDVLDSSASIRTDYLEVLDANTLAEIPLLKGEVLLAIAAFLGPVRLIDNITVQVS